MRQSCEHRKPSQALGSAHDRQLLEQDSKEVPPGCKITAQRTIIEPLSPWRKYLGGSIIQDKLSSWDKYACFRSPVSGAADNVPGSESSAAEHLN